MGFLNKIFSTETIDTVPEQGITSNYQEDTPQNTPEHVQAELTSVNLMSKFFRTQKLSPPEPPETLHENEAWAPETEYVGLFRKCRVNN